MAAQLGKQLSFAMRSLGLNAFRKQLPVPPVEHFDTLWSMMEAVRVATLSAILESKWRATGLGLGWAVLSRKSAEVHVTQITQKFEATSGLKELLVERYGKHRLAFILGIDDLKYAKMAYDASNLRRKKALMVLWERWYANMAGGAFKQLIKHKNKIRKRIQAMFKALQMAMNGHTRDCLYALIDNKGRMEKQERSGRKTQTDVVSKIVRAQKAKLTRALRKLQANLLEDKLAWEKKDKERLAYAMPDMDEINGRHEMEMEQARQEALRAGFVRRLEYSQFIRKKLAFDRMTVKPETKQVMDPALAKRWVFETMELRYKVKQLEACQVLRYPTIRRHQKQQASERLRGVVQESRAANLRLAFNRIAAKSPGFEARMAPLLDLLQKKVDSNLRLGLYSLVPVPAHVEPQPSPDQLRAVSALSKIILSKQATFDGDLRRSCFIKLGAELDPETSNGAKYHQQSYSFDLAMDKRIRLEANSHPKILSRLNARAEAAKLRRKIDEKSAQNAIYLQNMRNLQESTRKLQLKKEAEVRELVTRKQLGFSYEQELRRIFGELWGAGTSLRNGNDSHSLSHVNEAGDHTNKTTFFDQSVSKHVELEESVPNLLGEHVRRGAESEYPLAETPRTPMNFKLNASEKVFKEKEGRRLVKRLRELNLDSLVESQAFGMEEILTQLLATKVELEASLERLASDYNKLQSRAGEENAKLDALQARLDEAQQQKVRTEMRLIDLQDQKGVKALERMMVNKSNDEAREKSEEVQKQMTELQMRATLDAAETQELDRLRGEYFAKHQLIQANSSSVLKLDQELVELNRAIGALSEQSGELRAKVAAMEEEQSRRAGRANQDNGRLAEMKDEIRELAGQIAMNASVIESLELKKRGVASSALELSADRDVSGVQVLDKFKEGFLRLNELRLQKAKITLSQNELKREHADAQAAFEDLSEKIEESRRQSVGSSGLDSQVSDLNLRRKQAAANQERLAQRLGALSSEKEECQRNIDAETDRIKEFLVDYDEPDRPSNDASQIGDNRTDFLSKNSAYLSTRVDFGTTEGIENSVIRENLLNISKSSLGDENVRAILASKLNGEAKELLGINEANPLGGAAFDQVLAYVVERKRAYLQNNQLAFFNFLKKEEIDDRIKGNSCEILDLKEKILENEIAVRGWRKGLREATVKGQDAERVVRLAAIRRQRRSEAAPAVCATVTTQTALDQTLFGLRFAADKPDVVSLKMKGVGLDLNGFLDAAIVPKLRSRVLQKLEPLIQKKKLPGLNYLDLEEKDIFGAKNDLVGADGINLDLNESGIKDSLILDEYFPHEALGKRSIKRLNLNRQSLNYITPANTDAYQLLHKIVRKSPLVANLIKPAVKRTMEISPSSKILANANFESQKTKAVNLLARIVPRAIKNAANLNFYHLKLVASNERLRGMMKALSHFRIAHIKGKLGEAQGRLGNQAAQSIAEAIAEVVLARKRQAFRRIQAKIHEANRYRNWLLSKWMTTGDTNMRKHLRLVMQYWRHIRNDNLWNAKILKTMAIKAPLKPQIALWRLMLFKRRGYNCPPRVVRGLLSLINVVDSKTLRRALALISARKRPDNDFDARLTPERIKRPDPALLQSEIVAKESVDEDFGVKSQRLYSFFTYMGIIQKRNMMTIFYKFLEQAMAEPVQARLLRFEPKGLEPADQADSGIRTVRFLLDQQIKSKNEVTGKDSEIQDLREELGEKTQNLYFMQAFLLNLALRRVDRVMRRVFNRNAELAGFELLEALKGRR